MLFIDKNDLKPTNRKNGFINRKVICEICSTVQDDSYVRKVTMNFNFNTNVYQCPECKQKVSGLEVEKNIYFNNKAIMVDPKEQAKNEETLKIKMAGFSDETEYKEPEIVDLTSDD